LNLAELQRYFASAATSGSGPLSELDRVFSSTEQLSASDRLGIYNRGYFYRLLDALSSVFGQTKRELGEAEFERLGLGYIARHPSEHPAVERFGRSFAEYLRGIDAPTVSVDLAKLEWARLCALVAPNPSRVATADAIDPSRFPRARLRFVPSLHWLELDPRALSAFAGVDPATTALSCRVAVWRNRHVVLHQSLHDAEAEALFSAVEGATLSHVCAVFDSGSPAEDIRRAFQVLSGWFSRQWLESVTYDRA